MSAEDRAYLAARVASEWANGGFRTVHVPSLNAVAAVAGDVAADAAQVAEHLDAVSDIHALISALGASAYGVGNDPMDLVRAVFLNSEGFRQWDMAVALYPNVQDATYQVTEHDATKLLLCTSGTRTWTLPAATDVWVGWRCWLRNRSGNNLTLNRTGSDTINGAASGLTIATGSAILSVACTGASAFEVA